MYKLKIGRLGIDFDRNYGCDKRTGWGIAWHGHYLSQIEKHLIVTIIKAIKA